MTRISVQESKALGKARRKEVPREAHAEWAPTAGRPDPVALLEEQNADRLPWLVPIRHARMGVSPFTFYRGAARIMACDLASTPDSGLEVQVGGDAHLSNFGAYASPERNLVFDQNDFDETLPGPWEWDLKRLATSIMIAGQFLGLSSKHCRAATGGATRSYREAMHRFARMGYLDLWYDYVTTEDLGEAMKLDAAALGERVERFNRKARHKTSVQALEKLAERVDGRYQIRSDPPVLFPLRDLPGDYDGPALEAAATMALEAYKESIGDHRRALLDRYELVDIGMKVVGVGSVGTRCLLLLFTGRDDHDPLFLQAKEAGASVLEEYLAPSRYDNSGRRVVEGQRLTQAQSDIFLGWTAGSGPDHRHFYLRQLRDWKGSAEVDGASSGQLAFYGGLCGLTLARGHARTGDPEAIAAYTGHGESLDQSITAFAETYAAQNLEDYQAFAAAVADGRLECADDPLR